MIRTCLFPFLTSSSIIWKKRKSITKMKSCFIDFTNNKFDPVVICGKHWCGKGSCSKNVREAKGSAFRNLIMLCLDIMTSKKSEVKT